MSKLKAVENYLKSHGSMTSWEIATKIYSTNPQKFIEKLRKKYGVDAITDKWESKKVMIDNKKEVIRWKRYFWRLNEG